MPIRAPLSWLKEYVDIDLPVQELADRLTLAGIEVEHIVTVGDQWENIYTGQVTRLEKHPNADRLNLATVNYGAGQDITVVTGAPNIGEGQKVVLGLLGCRYLDQHSAPPRWSTLKPAKIRGIATEGMVMSEAELDLSDEHEGIIELDASVPVGLPAGQVLGDAVLVIDVTPNNGRTLSMVGLAREIAALFDKKLCWPPDEWEAKGPPASSLLEVEIQDPDLCPRYTGAVIRGITLGPSPYWMQHRIRLAGMRPINNIVDITNYVMLEMGQPLHAFNYQAVEGHKIVVRRARPGEHLVTLDHVDRELDPRMLAICDVERPVALAGVMGGEESEITERAHDVLLESAHFNPLSIRRTARVLKLPSEASYRFERFVDPNLTVPAMKRAAELMRQIAGSEIAEGYVDAYPKPVKPKTVYFYVSEVTRLLGIKVPPSQVAEMLRRDGFEVEMAPNADVVGDQATLAVHVPTYRNDVSLPADLVEEVARMIGYDLIPETLLQGQLPPQEPNRSRDAEEELRDIIVACGLDEVITYSVADSEALHKLADLEARGGSASGEANAGGSTYRSWDPSRPLVTVVNPLSSQQDVMRTTLWPNMLDTLRNNLKVLPESPVRIFDVGKIFLTRNEAEVVARRQELEQEREMYPRLQTWDRAVGEEFLPIELRRLTGLMAGPRYPRSLYYPDIEAAQAQTDFFDAKAVVEELLRQLHIGGVEWVRAEAPMFHPGRVAIVRANGRDLGVVGELHPSLIEAWDIPASRVAGWDLDVEALVAAQPGRNLYEQVSPHLPVRQDMAFVVDASTPAETIAEAIRRAAGASVTDVSLFDIYTGKPVPEGQKSLAYAITFNSAEKPLTEEDVARIRKRVQSMLERELGAKLRT